MFKELILPVILAFIAGNGVAVAILALLKDSLDFKRKRKAQLEDRLEDREERKFTEWQDSVDNKLKAQDAKLDAQGEGMKFLLYDRIQHLGQEYIGRKEVTFDERTAIHKAHNVYHNGLHGNGDLDMLMEDVDRLPLVVNK